MSVCLSSDPTASAAAVSVDVCLRVCLSVCLSSDPTGSAAAVSVDVCLRVCLYICLVIPLPVLLLYPLVFLSASSLQRASIAVSMTWLSTCQTGNLPA